jgi:hypothetical protein
MMMIATGRNEGRLVPQALHQFETEHAAVKDERAVEVGDFQMHVAEADARIDRDC